MGIRGPLGTCSLFCVPQYFYGICWTFQCEHLSEELESTRSELDNVKSELQLANIERQKVRVTLCQLHYNLDTNQEFVVLVDNMAEKCFLILIQASLMAYFPSWPN